MAVHGLAPAFSLRSQTFVTMRGISATPAEQVRIGVDFLLLNSGLQGERAKPMTRAETSPSLQRPN